MPDPLIDYTFSITLGFTALWIGVLAAFFWYVIFAMAVGVPISWGMAALRSR